MTKLKNKILRLKKYKIAGYIVAAIAVAILLLWRFILPQTSEYPFRACQGDRCIEGNQMSRVENCVVNERRERVCGWYVLFVDKKVKIEIEQ